MLLPSHWRSKRKESTTKNDDELADEDIEDEFMLFNRVKVPIRNLNIHRPEPKG